MRPFDLNVATWRKSSYSNQDGGACVEVADDLADAVPVRDSKCQRGPVLVFGSPAWVSFVASVKGVGRRS
ncbi:DUF397 domain-containing protein [Streptomyces sp. RFCAC02]|uniref:DUF397 domain-containing protein n=1 Tax=Streptomyces sp. RFCAC02 TaxID=2499143 RepID=UPI00101EAC3B|nr:DUF397 domain-containing protein [Streptomyces sp. RFCAC02]